MKFCQILDDRYCILEYLLLPWFDLDICLNPRLYFLWIHTKAVGYPTNVRRRTRERLYIVFLPRTRPTDGLTHSECGIRECADLTCAPHYGVPLPPEAWGVCCALRMCVSLRNKRTRSCDQVLKCSLMSPLPVRKLVWYISHATRKSTEAS